MKRKNLQPRIFYPARVSFRFDGEIKAFQTSKSEKTLAPQNQLYNKYKWNSLGRKLKRRKRSTQNKSKAIKKMVVGSYISIITLTVSGLNAPTKRHGLAGAVRTCACMHSHLPHHSTWNPTLCVFYIVNHVSIIACNCNYLFFLSGYWLWKLINSFYSCGKKTKHAVFQGHSCLLLWPTLCGVCFFQGLSLSEMAHNLWSISL